MGLGRLGGGGGINTGKPGGTRQQAHLFADRSLAGDGVGVIKRQYHRIAVLLCELIALCEGGVKIRTVQDNLAWRTGEHVVQSRLGARNVREGGGQGLRTKAKRENN